MRCPFCHNFALATYSPQACKSFKDAEEAKKWLRSWLDAPTEWVHVTGGEPAVSPREVALVAEVAGELGKMLSINSNLMHAKAAELIKSVKARHVAFDIKMPFTLTGLPSSAWRPLAANFVANLKALKGLEMEARIPVAKGLTLKAFEVEGYVKLLRLLRDFNVIIRVQKLIHGKDVKGWSGEWCSKYCNASGEEVFEVAHKVKELTKKPVCVYLPDKRKYELL